MWEMGASWQRGVMRWWGIASEDRRVLPPQPEPEVGGHLVAPRYAPAGVRHAVPAGASTTQCGRLLDRLHVFEELEWPGERGAIVCTGCALGVIDAIKLQALLDAIEDEP